MDSVRVEIDGRPLVARAGSTILEIARSAGIHIPTLCHDDRLKPYGGCRLCLVEVEGARSLLPACYTRAENGMVIHTATERVERTRKTIVQLLISDHPMECAGCTKSGRCELQELAHRYGISGDTFAGEHHDHPLFDENPFILRDYNKCINCGRCIRICREVMGIGVYDFVNRGFDAVPGTPFGHRMQDTPCEFCGQCVSTCPTGAIEAKPYEAERRTPAVEMLRSACAEFGKTEKEMITALGLEAWKTRTTCPYCGCGCQIDLRVIENEIVEVTAPMNVPPNYGNLCVKGRFGHDFVSSPDRLTKPLIRKGNRLVEAPWEEALDLVASRFMGIRDRNGADALGFFSSAKITNEENYLVQKFARAVVGTNNVDNCARLCHAPSVSALARTFGSGAMTNSIEDLSKAKAMIVIGSNTTEAHPIVAIQLIRAVTENCCKLIVIDPRRIRLCDYADLWLQQRGGTDVALLNAMMNVIISDGLHDLDFIERRTERFEELATVVSSYTPEFAEKITGVPADLIVRAARTYASADPAAIVYCLGITQHITGVDNVKSLASLAMLTGNIGKPGAGVNPLRGQNNVQGACDMGALPDKLPGYAPVEDPDQRARFESRWGRPLPDRPGLTATEMLDKAHAGELRSLFIIGENSLLSDANCAYTHEALSNLEFLVVSDIFLTETAELADVVLPAACYAEKEGTFTNTDRRFLRVRKAVDSPGEAKTDAEIIGELSRRMGYDMCTTEPCAVLDEVASLSSPFGGKSHRRLDACDPALHWPCPDEAHPGTPILHMEDFSHGKGLFLPAEYGPPDESPDNEYPLVLNTGIMLWQYHTGTMTRRTPGIDSIDPHGCVWISPEDADRLGVEPGEKVRVSTRRGSVEIHPFITKRMATGALWMAFHYAEAPANALTNNALDPQSMTPEFKICAARIDPV